ncbi:DoxX family protein [Arcanobacterium ihumii]|uniref:DoxX family protein n=1 Tax=Arcanobacterium ihumii TaxID=2138162 RepID=UPI000F5376F4|nr:DoxX family protein [Arcanobacterium ihumii]
MSVLRTIARPMLAAPFILAGFDAAIQPESHRERARKIYDLVAKFGIQAPTDKVTDMVTRGTGATMIACGLALSHSRLPRLSTGLLGALQVPLALANNPFWEHHGADQRKDFLNLASAAGLIGGALIASTDREGKPSVAWRLNKWTHELSDSAGNVAASVESKAKELGVSR